MMSKKGALGTACAVAIICAGAPAGRAVAANDIVAQGGSIQLAPALRTQRQTQLEQTYLRGLASKLDITVDQIELAKLQNSLK